MNAHYKKTKIDPLRAYREGLLTDEEFRGFCKGNIIKYVHRYRFKNGVEDLEKAKSYIDELISFEKRSKGKNEVGDSE